MPRVGWDTQADWDAWYSPPYGRSSAGDLTNPDNRTNRELGWLLALGIGVDDRVLVAGCGFGYLMEAARNAGHPYWGGIENSTHIETNRGAEADGGIVWITDDLRTGGQLQQPMRQMQRDLGLPGNRRNGRWDWIVTESLVESYDDTELDAGLNEGGLFAVCEWGLDTSDLSHIVHLVFTAPFEWEVRPYVDWDDLYLGPQAAVPYPNPTFQSRTLAEWKARRPAHTWVDAETGETL